MDARAEMAHEHHEAATTAKHRADLHRQRRDAYVLELRTEDPVRWSYAQLARAVGCSKTLIRQILEHEEKATPTARASTAP